MSVDFTEKYPAEIIFDGANLTVVPCNDKTNEALATFFTAHGDHTTLVISQPSAERDGYGQSNDPYSSLLFTTS